LLHYVQKQLMRRLRPQSVKKGGKGEDEDDDNKGDVEMEDTEGRPKESWEKFKEGDDNDAQADGEGDVKPSGRKKRAREQEPPNSVVMAQDAMQALLDAWEAESDGEGEGGSARKGKRKRQEVSTSTWIHEDANVPLDFMSADAAHSVLTTRPPQLKRQKGQMDAATGAENRADALRRHGLRFAEDGRLVIDETVETANKDSDDEEEGRGKGKLFNHGTVSNEKPLSKLAAMRAARARAKAKARMERRGSHIVKGLDSFKPGSKKASGDAMRKGTRLNPFAYVRLNPKITKEKFRSKATESFEKVLKGTKKGVLKGKKAKLRDAKKKQFAVEKKRRRGKQQRPTHLR
jgi:hypothetical protein